MTRAKTRVSVYLTTEENEVLNKMAHLHHLGMSAYLRKLIGDDSRKNEDAVTKHLKSKGMRYDWRSFYN